MTSGIGLTSRDQVCETVGITATDTDRMGVCSFLDRSEHHSRLPISPRLITALGSLSSRHLSAEQASQEYLSAGIAGSVPAGLHPSGGGSSVPLTRVRGGVADASLGTLPTCTSTRGTGCPVGSARQSWIRRDARVVGSVRSTRMCLPRRSARGLPARSGGEERWAPAVELWALHLRYAARARGDRPREPGRGVPRAGAGTRPSHVPRGRATRGAVPGCHGGAGPGAAVVRSRTRRSLRRLCHAIHPRPAQAPLPGSGVVDPDQPRGPTAPSGVRRGARRAAGFAGPRA